MVHRSHTHTEKVRHAFENDMKKMWDGYGIIGDVIVSKDSTLADARSMLSGKLHSLLQRTSLEQTSMSSSHPTSFTS